MTSTSHIAGPPVLPSRQMLAEGVYRGRKGQVMNLTIPPGARINIDKLARELRVSNTPLREALTRLEAEGLVIRRNLRGYWTGLMDKRRVRDYYAVRLLLEPSAAEEAARSPELAALTADLQKIPEQTQSPTLHAPDRGYSGLRNFAEADARFHGAIAAASGNAVLANMLAGMNAHVHTYRLYFRGGTGRRHRYRAPKQCWTHLTARDSVGAAAAMRTHLAQRAIDCSP